MIVEPGSTTSETPRTIPALLAVARMVRPYWGALVRRVALGVAVGLFGLLPPLFSKFLIDDMYPAHDLTLLNVLVAGSLALGVALAFANTLQGFFSYATAAQIRSAVELAFFNHLQHLSARFFVRTPVGESMSRFTDVRRAAQVISQLFETLVLEGLYVLWVPALLFWLQWKLTLVVLATVPLRLMVMGLAGGPLRRASKRAAEAGAATTALQVEALTQIRTVKALSAEAHVWTRVRASTVHALRMDMRAATMNQMASTAIAAILAFNTALYTYFGWRLILSGELSLGGYISFTSYIGFLAMPMARLVGMYQEVQQTVVSVHRMLEVLDVEPELEPEIALQPRAPVGHVIGGEITLDGVGFEYVPGTPILDGLDLAIPRGSLVALVGASGSGKSTLIRLLCALERPQRGRILLDGTDAATIAVGDIRRQVATVWQDAALFRGTLLENLTLGLADVPREAVERAVRLAQLESTVAALPQGYESHVAEGGATLSGGQRQRVAIARALLQRASIVLLDEPTASIDPTTEGALLQDVFHALRGQTVLFATHRVAAAARADWICVLAHGRIVATGTHAQLEMTCPAYGELLALQERSPAGAAARAPAALRLR